MKKRFGWLFSPLLLALLGLVCIAAVIWFGGPLLAIAQWHPLETELARWLLIAAIAALWLGKKLGVALRAKLANQKLLGALNAKPAQPPGESADPQLVQVRERFSTAMAALRDSPLGQARGPLDALFGRNRYVYQLPWYLFIGPPGSGKTTALLNSGLEFPLAKRLGNDPVRGIAGTRNCDWWFTNQAVMIDTAGRYTTQDSDAASDAREWTEFLAQLKRYRPRQPINGALVTVSVADLLTLTDAQLTAQAAAVRNRLSELQQTLDNRFPVYLLITKADLLAGFNEYFGALDKEQRAQVWGSTFAFQDSAGNALDRNEFVAGFDQLVQRIDALTPARMQAERDLTRRVALFGLAHQLGALRPALQAFVTEAFPVDGVARAPIVRGFYFTSGTQEGSPIDRVVGALTRSLGLARQHAAATLGTAKAFFLQRLLHDVVFAEAGLAGTNLQWERRLTRLKWGAAALSLAVGAGALAAWTASYLRNLNYVDQVQLQAGEVAKAMPSVDAISGDLGAILTLLKQVRGLAATDSVDPQAPQWLDRLGLFQGHKLSEAADQAYQRLLNQTLAPALANRLASALGSNAGNPELRYETLKTATMLSTPGKLDADAVRGWIAFDLETSAPILDAERRGELLNHVDAMLARNTLIEAVQVDERVIAQVRQSLAATPFAHRVYSRLKRQSSLNKFPMFRISEAGGPSAAAVFMRASGAPVTEGVPGLYTYDGYHKGFARAVDGVVKDLASEETWVLGIKESETAKRAQTPGGKEQLTNEVKRIYLQDYATHWERFVGDITLIKSNGLAHSIQTARILSAPDSPLVLLLRAVIREVTLSASDPKNAIDKAVDGVSHKVNDAAKAAKEKLGELIGTQAQPTAAPNEPRIEAQWVDDRFKLLRDYVMSPTPGAPARIDQTTALLGEVYNLLVATDAAVKAGNVPPPSDLSNKVKADGARLPEPIRSMVSTLANESTKQSLDATRGNISKNLSTNVGEFCVKALAGRYPLAQASNNDITPEDFARVFGPAGLLDDFFQKTLAPHVDTSIKPWRFRKTGDVSMGTTADALVQFERAAAVRNVFFVGGKGPALRVEFKPIEMDPAILQLTVDVDGQLIQYAHGPQVPKSVQWPGIKGTNQIRLQISPPGPSGSTGVLFEGPWAMHRMFDRAQIEPGGTPERFRAILAVDGRRIVFDVTTSSVVNPFRMRELQQFQCPKTL